MFEAKFSKQPGIAACIAVLTALSAHYPAHATEPGTEEIVVSARQVEESVFETPYSVAVINADRIREASFRSTPDIFREVPGALVQKTAHGQGSPYIRGFTGYRNLFMIDGIRLNNAVFRDGPNQYWATVDPGSIERMEVVRGPQSVLYGSDAIGGAVNVLTRKPKAYRNGEALSGGIQYRYAHGEDSHIAHANTDLALGQKGGLYARAGAKKFGDIESGAGELPNTGYDEWTVDAKLHFELSDNLTLTGAHSQVHQDDVPRTHKTTASRPFQGTDIGTEYSRNLDQDRVLTYARLEVDKWLATQNSTLTLYHNRQKEERQRLRSGNRSDQQGVEVNTYGVTVVTNLPTEHWGILTAGFDWAHDEVDSHSSSNPVQGPVADDSSYDWAGVYLQTRYDLSTSLDLTAGMRLGYFEADAGSVSDPNGGAFSYQQDWTEPVGNLRLGWTPSTDEWYLFAGISQGFRAPNLSDLTRFDSARSNEFEVPSVNLEPERYTSYELGARFSTASLQLEGTAYYTDIKDQIQRLLTGELTAEGEHIVTKANVGDGDIYGIEMSLNWSFANHWLAFGHYAWLDGEISTEAEVGAPTVKDNHSRMMPSNYRAGVRYNPDVPRRWWLESEVVRVEDADQLSLRDESDSERIPAGGTPAYTLWHIRGGLNLGENLYLNLTLENLTDENYRVHGSGQNEPGRNFVIAVEYSL